MNTTQWYIPLCGICQAGTVARPWTVSCSVWLAVATLGLAVVAQTFHEIFLIIKYAGAAYLVRSDNRTGVGEFSRDAYVSMVGRFAAPGRSAVLSSAA